MCEIRGMRPKPGNIHELTVQKERSTQMTAAPGDASWRKKHLSGFVGCRALSVPGRVVRGGQHRLCDSPVSRRWVWAFYIKCQNTVCGLLRNGLAQAPLCFCVAANTSPAVSVTLAYLETLLSWRCGGLLHRAR